MNDLLLKMCITASAVQMLAQIFFRNQASISEFWPVERGAVSVSVLSVNFNTYFQLIQNMVTFEKCQKRFQIHIIQFNEKCNERLLMKNVHCPITSKRKKKFLTRLRTSSKSAKNSISAQQIILLFLFNR